MQYKPLNVKLKTTQKKKHLVLFAFMGQFNKKKILPSRPSLFDLAQQKWLKQTQVQQQFVPAVGSDGGHIWASTRRLRRDPLRPSVRLRGVLEDV